MGIATCYGERIESRRGRRDYPPVQTGTGAHPAPWTMDTGSFPRVKRPGRGVNHPTPASAEVKEEVKLYINSPSVPSWQVMGWTLTFTKLAFMPIPVAVQSKG